MKKLSLFLVLLLLISMFPLQALAADENNDSYNDHDVAQISAFLNQTSSGLTNAEILGYADPNDPAIWSDVSWVSVDGEQRVQSINWGFKDTAGVLDLSGCTALTELYCLSIGLTSLDVSGCTALSTLSCEFNSLTSLDVSTCSSLSQLSCYVNAIETLNVSGCSNLTWLNCSENKLTQLDVNSCANLGDLDCSHNNLSSLDVSGCPLGYLSCTENPLKQIHAVIEGEDVKLNASAGYLKLSYLAYDIEGEMYVDRYSASAVPDSMPCSGWTGMQDGVLFSSDDSNIDLEIGCSYDITANFASGTVYNDHDVTKMQVFLNKEPLEGPNYMQLGYDVDDPSTWNDVTWVASPEGLRISAVEWNERQAVGGTLDLSGCAYLESVDFYGNELHGLNLNGCAALKNVSCNDNYLDTLSLSGCDELTSLKLNNNNGLLIALELQGYTKLEHLECVQSLLDTLDVGGCTALTYLDCSNTYEYNRNFINTLDLSDSTGLTTLKCAGNPLARISAIMNDTVIDLTAGGWGYVALSEGGETAYTVQVPDTQPFSSWIGTQDGSPFFSAESTINLTPGSEYVLMANFGYGVFYDGNGATGGTVPDGGRHNAGDSIGVRSNSGSLERAGFEFAGWNTAADGSGTSYSEDSSMMMPAENITLYAVWEPIAYTITYDLDGGEAQNPATYNALTPAFTLNNPTKLGYVFAGWTGTDLANAAMSVSFPAGSIGDRAYTANWAQNTVYTVTFDAKNGSAVDSIEVNAGGTIETAPVTSRFGYNFTGWYTKKGVLITFPYHVTGSVTLYAGWEKQPKTAYLSDVELSSGTLDSNFSNSKYLYLIRLPESETSFTLTPVKEYDGASMSINGESTSSYTVNLENHRNALICVIVQNGKSIRLYTFIVHRGR